jgi:hypothetical protein
MRSLLASSLTCGLAVAIVSGTAVALLLPPVGMTPMRSDLVPIEALGGAGLLKRRDKAPPTIRPQLVSQDPAGADEILCMATTGRDTGGNYRATPAECKPEITDTLQLWYKDLEDARGNLLGPISVVITRPDGQTRTSTITEVNRGYDAIYLRPGSPLGRWDFVATAAGRSSNGGFTVRSPSKRILLAMPEVPGAEISPGAPVEVHLAGYRPAQRVSFYLYYRVGHRDVGTGETIFQYATAIGQSAADSRGEAIITFSTERDDPVGTYLVASLPVQQNLLYPAIFELKR